MNLILTVGTGVQFDRLVRAADDWAGRHPEHRVFMQIGYSTYQPRHAAEFFAFAPFAHFQELFGQSEVAVSHGSAGPILAARRLGLPLVLVPRQARFGEMPNDHQVEVCEAIRDESAMREIVLEMADFESALERAMARRRAGQRYEPHLLKERLVAAMAAFVEKCRRD